MKSIEICAGAGGLSLGLEMSNFEHLLLLENNKKCCETLKINKPDWNVICEDVNKFDIIDYMKKNKLKKGVCDLLCGGIPCQPFSNAGLRKGFDDVRANVFETFLYFIEKIQPKIFLIENVKGMLTLNKGEIFKEIISKLEEKKYKIFHKVLNANDFNVAQKRERLFIVGVDKRLINKDFTFNFPKINIKKLVLKNVLENIKKDDRYQLEYYNYNDRMKELLNKIPQGGCWTSLNLEEQKEILGGSFESGGGKRGVGKRLSLNEPSLTLTTSPIQKQTSRCHPLLTRSLTVREYARIQSFPDDWIFFGSKAEKYKQIGNAVPVNLAKEMSQSIMNVLLELKNEKK